MIDWNKFNAREDSDYAGWYSIFGLPFQLCSRDGYLSLMVSSEYVISKNTIPATNESIELLLKAFNV